MKSISSPIKEATTEALAGEKQIHDGDMKT